MCLDPLFVGSATERVNSKTTPIERSLDPLFIGSVSKQIIMAKKRINRDL